MTDANPSWMSSVTSGPPPLSTRVPCVGAAHPMSDRGMGISEMRPINSQTTITVVPIGRLQRQQRQHHRAARAHGLRLARRCPESGNRRSTSGNPPASWASAPGCNLRFDRREAAGAPYQCLRLRLLELPREATPSGHRLRNGAVASLAPSALRRQHLLDGSRVAIARLLAALADEEGRGTAQMRTSLRRSGSRRS